MIDVLPGHSEKHSVGQGARRRRNSRRGSLSLLSVFFFVVMLALCAFSIDLSYLMVVRTELQRTADAAALAAAEGLIDYGELKGIPNPTATNREARTTAAFYTALNRAGGREPDLPANEQNVLDGDLVLGHLPRSTGQFSLDEPKYNAVKVRVRRDSVANGVVPMFFAQAIGVSQGSVTAEAAAFRLMDVNGFQVNTDRFNSKLLSFALQIDTWLAALETGADDFTHNYRSRTVTVGADNIREVTLFPSGIGPGNFGTVDIGAPNNSTAELARQILHGPNKADFAYFPNSRLELGPDGTVVLQGDTGISAGVKDELAAIKGLPRIIPLYGTVSGNGNNARFSIVGFAGITILKVRLTGPMRNRYIRIQPAFAVDRAVVGGGEDGVTSRYVRSPVTLVPF